MDEVKNILDLIDLNSEKITLPFAILNFVICFIVSMVLKKYYENYSNSLTGKFHIGTIIPTLSLIVFILIIIIKSSLALSLGLVGALSIVRFRTHIKEPEELVYLFLAITIGLGFGAGYTLLTTLLVSFIIIINYLFLSVRKENISNNEYTLLYESKNNDLKLQELIDKLNFFTTSIKFIRVDSKKQKHSVVLLISLSENSSIENIVALNNDNESISLFEANNNW